MAQQEASEPLLGSSEGSGSRAGISGMLRLCFALRSAATPAMLQRWRAALFIAHMRIPPYANAVECKLQDKCFLSDGAAASTDSYKKARQRAAVAAR
jgi:hypothetical protein